ncbi:conserved hypothetical protein [Sphingobium sp. SYK-6]|uniref:TadE/TadG family type IV pilus assembly protein n=1 Tax=Sphingobium sp. (strain NBRC 103272 / SYK-6) TaxID=627192 RepID=UPI0002277201|nr:TadE/TadG family type IV pilus assembly protein [Sphingobium sp. SYK-6]BAK65889.1 conserved hypothetical protein [Sphingobium sp. SYK-6]
MTILRLMRCARGASILEFAILAPLFIAMLVGLIEFGRAYWIRQSLAEVAFHTARCMAMDTACANQAQSVAFAVARASDYTISIAPSAVVPTSGVSCRGQANSHQVVISTPFLSPIASFGFLPENLQVTACFPVFSSGSGS